MFKAHSRAERGRLRHIPFHASAHPAGVFCHIGNEVSYMTKTPAMVEKLLRLTPERPTTITGMSYL